MSGVSGGRTAPALRAPGAPAVLRVAIVCPYDLSRPGGVQGQALGIARALRKAGHRSIVVAPGDRRPGWATGDLYTVGRALGVRANGSVAPVALSPAAAARALGAVRRWGPDVVHLHEPLAPVTGYGFLARPCWPTVATFHRSGLDRVAGLAKPLGRWAVSRIDVRCAVSKEARRTAIELCGGAPESYDVLFNGVDVDRFARARPAGSDAPSVLFLGRHERRKGLSVLLEAFAGLTCSAELWIAGSGPDSERLRARHPESARVHWLGVLSDDEVADRLAGSAVVCAPSLGGESFGMVLLEAMASGCSVVASDIPGYEEAAAGHATLVPPGDVGALRAALDAALADAKSGSHARRVEAARRHASQWSMDRLAERYVDRYRRAMSAHGPRASTWSNYRGRP